MLIKIADIVFGVSSDLPMESLFIDDAFRKFLCKGTPDVAIHEYYSGLPDIRLRSEDRVFDS